MAVNRPYQGILESDPAATLLRSPPFPLSLKTSGKLLFHRVV